VIEYLAAEPVQAKGKAEPIQVWQAVQPRSNLGVEVQQSVAAPPVGREPELGFLRDALTRTRSERVPELVTLIGVPGIGKSRLVFELFGVVERDPDLVFWRQGRSLSYGTG
jgi:AAA ATPase-like protein